MEGGQKKKRKKPPQFFSCLERSGARSEFNNRISSAELRMENRWYGGNYLADWSLGQTRKYLLQPKSDENLLWWMDFRLCTDINFFEDVEASR